MTDFVINTAPFSVKVSNTCSSLLSALSELYPPSLLGDVDNKLIYDFCLNVKRKWSGFGRPFHVASGKQHFRMTDTEQILPVFEWGFNWCVASYQHQYLAIHAAVLERNGKALIMPAPPGSGKSTLCAALMLEGWRLLSDEMCLVDLDNGDIVPFVRPISLKNQSLNLVQRWYPTAQVRQITVGTTKGTVGFLLPTESSWEAYKNVAKPAWVVFPQYNAAVADMQLSALSKADAFMHLANNAFNYAVLAEQGVRSLGQLIQNIQAYRLEYSDIKQVIAELELL